MNDPHQHFHHRKMRQIGHEALDDWLYPNALYGGGGFADDRKCITITGHTEDRLDQVRRYYWEKCGLPMEFEENTSSYTLENDTAWVIFHSPFAGPTNIQAGLLTHVTSQRSITVFAMPSDRPDQLTLCITRIPHQSQHWKEPAMQT